MGVFNNHLSLTLQTLHKFRIIIPCTACYGILQSHALIKYYYLSVCLFCMNLLNRMGGDGETYKLFDSVDTRKKKSFSLGEMDISLSLNEFSIMPTLSRCDGTVFGII